MSIRPGLGERLAWMAKNVYIGPITCGICSRESIWCDKCKQSTLDANGGRLPHKWFTSHRAALLEYIKRTSERNERP